MYVPGLPALPPPPRRHSLALPWSRRGGGEQIFRFELNAAAEPAGTERAAMQVESHYDYEMVIEHNLMSEQTEGTSVFTVYVQPKCMVPLLPLWTWAGWPKRYFATEVGLGTLRQSYAGCRGFQLSRIGPLLFKEAQTAQEANI